MEGLGRWVRISSCDSPAPKYVKSQEGPRVLVVGILPFISKPNYQACLLKVCVHTRY